MEKQEMLNAALDALERLMRMFAIERYVYLALTGISFLLLLYSSFLLITSEGGANTAVLVGIFGSSGLIAVSSGRISWFFNKAFNLIERLIEDLRK